MTKWFLLRVAFALGVLVLLAVELSGHSGLVNNPRTSTPDPRNHRDQCTGPVGPSPQESSSWATLEVNSNPGRTGRTIFHISKQGRPRLESPLPHEPIEIHALGTPTTGKACTPRAFGCLGVVPPDRYGLPSSLIWALGLKLRRASLPHRRPRVANRSRQPSSVLSARLRSASP